MRRVVALLIVILILLSGCFGGGKDEWRMIYNGTEMGGQYAPDFTLINQNGENVSLSDFEGKIVVIAFTYTACPDVCPLIEANLNTVKANLGEAYGVDVVFISISIDPLRDTPEKLKSHWIEALQYDWDHLTHSDLEIISAVWSSYNIVVDEEVIELHLTHEDANHPTENHPEDWITDFDDDYIHWEAGNISNATMINHIHAALHHHHSDDTNATNGDCDGYMHEADNSTNASLIDLLELHCSTDIDDTELIEAVYNLTVAHGETHTEEHGETTHTEEEETAFDEDESYVVGHSSLTLILDEEHKKRVAWPGFAWNADDFTEDIQNLLDK